MALSRMPEIVKTPSDGLSVSPDTDVLLKPPFEGRKQKQKQNIKALYRMYLILNFSFQSFLVFDVNACFLEDSSRQ